jgi:carboxymethylenebutenolidase
MARPTILAATLLAPALLSLPVWGRDDYARKMEHEHRDDTAAASPAASFEPAQPVVDSEVVYARLGETAVSGYLARPKRGADRLPGLIVIQEWWGLNDNIRAMARRFAGEGYVVLAVDLYEGKSAATPDEASALMQEVTKDPARLLDNLKQAHEHLERRQGAGRIGVVGWCFGGGWALETALALGKRLDAAVLYYGRVKTDREELEPLRAPLLGHFGALDTGIPLEGVRAFEAALGELGKQATIHVYEGAGHAFANPTGSRYQEEAATLSWQRTVAFLAEQLKR